MFGKRTGAGKTQWCGRLPGRRSILPTLPWEWGLLLLKEAFTLLPCPTERKPEKRADLEGRKTAYHFLEIFTQRHEHMGQEEDSPPHRLPVFHCLPPVYVHGTPVQPQCLPIDRLLPGVPCLYYPVPSLHLHGREKDILPLFRLSLPLRLSSSNMKNLAGWLAGTWHSWPENLKPH